MTGPDFYIPHIGAHRTITEDTNFIVEIIKFPDTTEPDKFMILNGMSIINKTLNSFSNANLPLDHQWDMSDWTNSHFGWPNISYTYGGEYYTGNLSDSSPGDNLLPLTVDYQGGEKNPIPLTKKEMYTITKYFANVPIGMTMGDGGGGTGAGTTTVGGQTRVMQLAVSAVSDNVSAKNNNSTSWAIHAKD